jgi:hypothetical protein
MSGRATDLTWYCLFTMGERLVRQDKKGSVRDSSDIKSRAFATTNLQSISLIGNKTLVRWACPNVVYSAFPDLCFRLPFVKCYQRCHHLDELNLVSTSPYKQP